MASNYVTAEVIENQHWADNLFSLHLRCKLQPFKAGQFVKLQLQVGDELIAKPYSLVNPPGADHAEIYYNTVEGGLLSNALAALKTGDSIEVSQPGAGFFVLDEVPDARDLWMMATGTGLGPYLSILQQGTLWERFENVRLVHAASWANNLAYQDMVAGFAGQQPERFRYISVVSREDNPGSLRGRIPALITDGQLEAAADLEIAAENSHIMLCGNQNMITDVRAVLAERDMRKHLRRKPGHITTEQYF